MDNDFDPQLRATVHFSGSWWFLKVGGKHVAHNSHDGEFFAAIAARLNAAADSGLFGNPTEVKT